MTKMRAKFVVDAVERHQNCERITFRAVCKADGYPPDGTDENNTFATFTPQADLSMTITNPMLFGQFVHGEQYYADFSKAD